MGWRDLLILLILVLPYIEAQEVAMMNASESVCIFDSFAISHCNPEALFTGASIKKVPEEYSLQETQGFIFRKEDEWYFVQLMDFNDKLAKFSIHSRKLQFIFHLSPPASRLIDFDEDGTIDALFTLSKIAQTHVVVKIESPPKKFRYSIWLFFLGVAGIAAVARYRISKRKIS